MIEIEIQPDSDFKIEIGGGGSVDLSNYATKDDLNNKADKSHTHAISDITDLQTALDDKVSNERLDEVLSSHQGNVDLSSYATKSQLNDKADKSELTHLTTLEQVKALIAEAELDDLTLEQVQAEILKAVADKAAADAVKAKDDEHDRKIAALESSKANATHTHTWSQISNVPTATTARQGIVKLNNTLTSTSQTDALTANAGRLLSEKIAQLENVDLSDYATKAELNGKASTSEVADINANMLEALSKVASTEQTVNTLANKNTANAFMKDFDELDFSQIVELSKFFYNLCDFFKSIKDSHYFNTMFTEMFEYVERVKLVKQSDTRYKLSELHNFGDNIVHFEISGGATDNQGYIEARLQADNYVKYLDNADSTMVVGYLIADGDDFKIKLALSEFIKAIN